MPVQTLRCVLRSTLSILPCPVHCLLTCSTPPQCCGHEKPSLKHTNVLCFAVLSQIGRSNGQTTACSVRLLWTSDAISYADYTIESRWLPPICFHVTFWSREHDWFDELASADRKAGGIRLLSTINMGSAVERGYNGSRSRGASRTALISPVSSLHLKKSVPGDQPRFVEHKCLCILADTASYSQAFDGFQ